MTELLGGIRYSDRNSLTLYGEGIFTLSHYKDIKEGFKDIHVSEVSKDICLLFRSLLPPI